MSLRTRSLLAVGSLLLTVGTVLSWSLRSPSEGAAGSVPPLPAGLGMLAAWDGLRADAYAAGDVAALGALYAPGSVSGRRDVELLRAYADRGLAVRGMRMQLLACKVVRARPRRVRLLVTDRLQGAFVVRRSARDPTAIRLPADRASRRVVTFVRRSDSWVVEEVSAATPRR
jgi:hypothetical protein